MGITEAKTWMISCDRCPVVHGIVTATSRPSLPKEWSYVKVDNCGMTGYTRHDVLCPMCVEREARKNS